MNSSLKEMCIAGIACFAFAACQTAAAAEKEIAADEMMMAAAGPDAPGQTDIVGLIELEVCQNGVGDWTFTDYDSFGFQQGFSAPQSDDQGNINLTNVGREGDVIIIAHVCPFVDGNATDMLFYTGDSPPARDNYQAVGIADCGSNTNCTGATNPPQYGSGHWPNEFTAPLVSDDGGTLVFIDLDDAPGRGKTYYYALRIVDVNSNEVTVLDPKIVNKNLDR